MRTEENEKEMKTTPMKIYAKSTEGKTDIHFHRLNINFFFFVREIRISFFGMQKGRKDFVYVCLLAR